MSTSPTEVRKRRSWGPLGALALCLMALGMAGGKAHAAATEMTLTSHSPTHYPQPGSVQVPLNAPIILNFNGPVDPDTTDANHNTNLVTTNGGGNAKITVSPSVGAGGVDLGLSASISGNTITINHSTPFDTGTFYIVTVKGIKTNDTTGAYFSVPDGVLVPVSGSASNPFTFRSLDTSAPYIDNHTPTNNDNAAVGPNGALAGTGTILIVFNKAMNPDTVIANTTISENTYLGTTVDLKPNAVFTFDQTGTTLSISPKKDANGNLIPWGPGSKSANQPSRITVSVGGTDIVGNVLGANPNGVTASNQNPFTFRVADIIPPGLQSSSPATGQSGVTPFANIVLHFDEPIDCSANMTTQSQVAPALATFLIYQVNPANGSDISGVPPGQVTAACTDAQTVTLTHTFSFSSNQTYGVRILGDNNAGTPNYALRDLVGNHLANSITVTFTAGNSVPPAIASSTPAPGQGLPTGYLANPNVDPFMITVVNGINTVLDQNLLNANRVSPTAPIVINFTEPIDTTTFASELRERVPGKTADTDFTLIPTTVSWSNNNTTATITPNSPLDAGDNSIFQLRVITANDTSGNALQPGSIPGNLLIFRTQDLTGPAVVTLNPANGAQLQPDGTTLPPAPANPAGTITITMSEPIKNDAADLPIISIKDARPADDPTVVPLPVLQDANGNDLVPFASSAASRTVLYQIPGSDVTNALNGGTPNSTVSTIHLKFQNDILVDNATGALTSTTNNQTAAGATNVAFAPGETYIFQLTQAFDLNGNNIRVTPTNPWIYNINDTRSPRVTRVRVGGITIDNSATGNQSAGSAAVVGPPAAATVPSTFPLVALNAPVEVTFSKPMSTADADRLTFAADGDWTPSATNTGTTDPVNQLPIWKANASSYSADLRTVTLTHVPFPEANPSDTNVANDRPNAVLLATDMDTDKGGSYLLHTFTIENATDQNMQMLKVAGGVVRTTGNVPITTTFITSSLPRVSDVQFEVNTNGTPDNNGLLDPDTTKRSWVSFKTGLGNVGGTGNLSAIVPLNSRFKFIFTSQMNESTVPPPIGGPTLAHGWTASWSADSTTVVWDHADLLPGPNQPYQHPTSGVNAGLILPSGAIFSNFRLGSASDFKGDSLGGDQTRGVAFVTPTVGTNVNTIDVTPPSTMTVEYLANIKAKSTNGNIFLCDANGNETQDLTKEVWKPLNGAVEVPINTIFRVRLNETFGPGNKYLDSKIAFGIAPTSANKGVFSKGGAFTNVSYVNGNGASVSQARQDWSPSSTVTIAGGQTMFQLNNLTGNIPGSGTTHQAANTYTLQFTAGDTRLDDNGTIGTPEVSGGVLTTSGTPCTDDTGAKSPGCPANGGVNGNLPNNVGGVPGNQQNLTASFTTANQTPPTVLSVAGTPSLAAEGPTGAITVQFDEPVDINSVNLNTISVPSGAPTPTFSKAYGNNGADKTAVVFTPTTPLVKPAIGAPNTYVFQVANDVFDLFNLSGANLTCNGENEQTNINLLNGNGTDRFTVGVPVSTVPPSVRSIVSTREEITLQFSEPVNSVTAGNAGYANSVLNPANYGAQFQEGQVPISAATLAGVTNATPNGVPTPGFVDYQYYNPNRVAIVNGQTVLSPGFVTAQKQIVGERYDANANAVVLQVSPLTEGQGSNQPETVQFVISNNLQDLNTNPIATVTESAPVQTGRADWLIQMGATSNVPGASPDTSNFFGVQGVAGVNNVVFPGPALPGIDIPKPLAPGANHVELYSARGNTEPGFAGLGGNYAEDIQSRPGLDEMRVWPNIGVTTDLGATGAPATITVTWNLALLHQEVPVTHSVELINLNPLPGEPTSIDMRAQNSFSYQVSNNGLDQTRFFRLEVTAPSEELAPFQLASGFNMVGVPVRAQNPAVGNVFFGLSPLVVYRYSSTTGYEIFPVSSNFTTIDPGRGYWVRPNNAGYQINVLGVPVVGQTTLSLHKGWNLISDPFLVPVNGSNLAIVDTSGNSQSVSAAVTAGLLQDSITTFDPVSKGYSNPTPLSTGTLQPWVGYWVLAFSDFNLVVNKPVPATP